MAAGLGEVGPSFTLLNVALCVWILQNCKKKKKKSSNIMHWKYKLCRRLDSLKIVNFTKFGGLGSLKATKILLFFFSKYLFFLSKYLACSIPLQTVSTWTVKFLVFFSVCLYFLFPIFSYFMFWDLYKLKIVFKINHVWECGNAIWRTFCPAPTGLLDELRSKQFEINRLRIACCLTSSSWLKLNINANLLTMERVNNLKRYDLPCST